MTLFEAEEWSIRGLLLAQENYTHPLESENDWKGASKVEEKV